MLDLFTSVYYSKESATFHASAACQTFSVRRRTDRTPLRSRLGGMLATGRQACKWCAPHLAVTPDEVHALLRPVVAA